MDIEDVLPYYKNPRPELDPFIPDKIRRMLDVGCGVGGFATRCRDRTGCQCAGIEFVPEVAEHARAVLDEVHTGDVNAILPTLPLASFDLVTFTDVLEHLPWPGKTLEQTKSVLISDGRVLASLPNILYWDAIRLVVFGQDFPYQDSGIFDRTHLRFFTKKSIRRLFEDAGYEVLTLEGINPTPSRKLRLLNFLTFGRFKDFKYLQFAVVARPLKSSSQ